MDKVFNQGIRICICCDILNFMETNFRNYSKLVFLAIWLNQSYHYLITSMQQSC